MTFRSTLASTTVVSRASLMPSKPMKLTVKRTLSARSGATVTTVTTVTAQLMPLSLQARRTKSWNVGLNLSAGQKYVHGRAYTPHTRNLLPSSTVLIYNLSSLSCRAHSHACANTGFNSGESNIARYAICIWAQVAAIRSLPITGRRGQ